MNSNNTTAAAEETLTVQLTVSELKTLTSALEMHLHHKAMHNPKSPSIQRNSGLVARLKKIING